MKKLILVAGLIFCYASTNATLFHYWARIYGDATFQLSLVGNGLQTNYTGSGHLVGGYNPFPGQVNLVNLGPWVVRTDIDGLIASPFNFNNTYEFLFTSSDFPISVNSSKVIELKNGTGYVSVSTFSYLNQDVGGSPIQYGLLYMKLDLNGNVISHKAYLLGYSNAANYAVMTGLREAETPLTGTNYDILVTGQVQQGANYYMFAARLDENGGPCWPVGLGQIYDFNTSSDAVEMPHDIIESPYGKGEIIIVGEGSFTNDPIGTGHDGFITRINSATGNVITTDHYDLGGYDVITAITKSIDGTGYGLCGYTQDDATSTSKSRVWFLRGDANACAVTNSKVYDNATRPNSRAQAWAINEVYDIDIADYQYVIGGHISDNNPPAPLNNDLFYIDVLTNGVNTTQLDYANYQGDDYINGIGNDLIPYIYSYNTFPGQPAGDAIITNKIDQHSCEYRATDIISDVNAPTNPQYVFTAYAGSVLTNRASKYVTFYNDNYLEGCDFYWDDTWDDPQEKTAKINRVLSEDNTVTVYPNPAEKNIELDVKNVEHARYAISNTLGSIIASGNYDMKHKIIDVSGFASGVYVLSVFDNDTIHNIRFVKQ